MKGTNADIKSHATFSKDVICLLRTVKKTNTNNETFAITMTCHSTRLEGEFINCINYFLGGAIDPFGFPPEVPVVPIT
jgi:hypothetical protein